MGEFQISGVRGQISTTKLKNRIIFTIIFNGLHHLQYNNQSEFILNNCDKWIVVEGASKSIGSTSWCKTMPQNLHTNGASIDGTRDFLESLAKTNDKLIYIPSNGFWGSKDHQVNRAIDEVKKITNECFLWQFDTDEQWTSETMAQAEKEMTEQNVKTGSFLADCYAGKDIIALGGWGEGPYTKLWNWNGEYFEKHKPPTLQCGNQKSILVSARFMHYKYYFEQDVIFKDRWYGGHEQIHERWKTLKFYQKKYFQYTYQNL